MKQLRILVASGLVSTLTALSITGTVFAWHPHGNITKSVQDVTTNSQTSNATDTTTALTVAPGDTLLYTVMVSNVAAAANNHDNDMVNTIMTDTLPAGVELIANPSQHQITENMGTLTPGSKVTKQYQIKVTSATEGSLITNKACYTGNSRANDNPQSGCAMVIVKIHIPQAPSYACTLLSVTKEGNRTVAINDFKQTETNGATFTNAVVAWGDTSTPSATNAPIGQSHTYTADGTYRIVATAHFSVNGTDRIATGDTCIANVTFSTTPTIVPTQPTELPNTGGGSVVLGAASATALGYAIYSLYLKHRIRRA